MNSRRTRRDTVPQNTWASCWVEMTGEIVCFQCRECTGLIDLLLFLWIKAPTCQRLCLELTMMAAKVNCGTADITSLSSPGECMSLLCRFREGASCALSSSTFSDATFFVLLNVKLPLAQSLGLCSMKTNNVNV